MNAVRTHHLRILSCFVWVKYGYGGHGKARALTYLRPPPDQDPLYSTVGAVLRPQYLFILWHWNWHKHKSTTAEDDSERATGAGT